MRRIFSTLILACFSVLVLTGQEPRLQWPDVPPPGALPQEQQAQTTPTPRRALRTAVLTEPLPYAIVYVRAPIVNGNTRMTEVFRPVYMEPKSDLMLLHPNGTEEVLVAGGDIGAIADPFVSFDGQWVYYAHAPDVNAQGSFVQFGLANNIDLWKINLKTREKVQLTRGEYTPSVFVTQKYMGTWNMGPTPVMVTMNGVKRERIVFTSNRNAFWPTKGYTPTVFQLFIMNTDGTEVELISPMTLGSALHPFQMKDGRIAFTSYESQGIRDQRIWAMWMLQPDGRRFEPLWSGFLPETAMHFATQTSEGIMAIIAYYNLNNWGFGNLFTFPAPSPGATECCFGTWKTAEATPIIYSGAPYTDKRGVAKMPFLPTGAKNATPWTHWMDFAADLKVTGDANSGRVGKITMPQAIPNNDLLVTYSEGAVNSLPRPIVQAPQGGIYIMRGGYSEFASELVKVKDDPAFQEIWARPVLTYKEIYGIDHPVALPYLPNDGKLSTSLPAGTAYGIIGTSSMYKHDSFPGWANFNAPQWDGLDAFYSDSNSNWVTQGADAGLYSNSEIGYVRIVTMEPRPFYSTKWFVPWANERLRILGEIPVRKFNQDGSPVLDLDGNPDTSWSAKIPADTPFTFQTLDRDKRVLNMAQTWHQVRPGEVHTSCGGCHAHAQKPLAFESTAAAKLLPVDLTLQPAHDVEFIRDVRPILQQKCVRCHGGATPAAQLKLDETQLVDPPPPGSNWTNSPRAPKDYLLLSANWSSTYGGYAAVNRRKAYTMKGGLSRWVAIYQSRRSLLAWYAYGKRLDGWTNERWPTESIPGDATTLPVGAVIDGSDPDYIDTVNHGTFLTQSEKERIAAWIDLGAGLDLEGSQEYFRDDTRPALAITAAENQIVIGVADAYSGIEPTSVKATLNNVALALTPLSGNRWAAPFAAGRVDAEVKDKIGNTTKLTRVVAATTPVPEPPPPVVVPGAPSVAMNVATCRYVVTATKPDSTTGWGAQFRRNGVNVSTKDTTPPYERTVTVASGSYTWDVLWTKTGVPNKVSAATVTTGCE